MIVFNAPSFAQDIAIEAGVVNEFNPMRDPSICNVSSDGLWLLGGVIFQDYTGEGGSINLHCAGFLPGWLSRALLWNTFNYAFNVVKVKKVIGKVHADNYKALKLNLHLGFKVETHIADVYPDGDLLIMSMYRDDCKWLSLRSPNVTVLDGTPQTPKRQSDG